MKPDTQIFILMTKSDALTIIDDHKNYDTIGLVEILHWTWLRAIINQIPDKEWETYVKKAEEVLSQ